jgi:DNA-binding HxlR family transcriptional regulator
MESEKRKLAKFRALMGAFVRKWTVEIMYCLYENKTMRFTDLRKMLSGISSRTLSDRLGSLRRWALCGARFMRRSPSG